MYEFFGFFLFEIPFLHGIEYIEYKIENKNNAISKWPYELSGTS